MSVSTKRVLAIVTIAILIFSTALATYSFWSTPSSSNENQVQPAIKPLDTTSKKVYATYEGGVLTEGEVNLYINIFFLVNPDPMMIISTDKRRNK
jgi:foldase protein PrsA